MTTIQLPIKNAYLQWCVFESNRTLVFPLWFRQDWITCVGISFEIFGWGINLCYVRHHNHAP